jgi:aryl-alcohol dehydrogenase-like predicted oxidoreductase
MSRIVRLASTLETTALGFGCASLFHEPERRRRLRLLEDAYDHGIRHFDVAPMYGLGVAERELGRFARTRRDTVVIATKFGIDPTAAARQLARVQAPVRRVFRAIPFLGRQARASASGPSSGPAGRFLYASCGYDAEAAKASLERSLRELGTEFIDLLFLHDAAPSDVADDVQAYLDDAVRAGLIRAWGIAGEAGVAMEVAASLPGPVPVLQVRDDIFVRSDRVAAAPGGPTQGRISFGILGGALPRLVAHVSATPERVQRWSDLLGVDCGDPEALATLLLRDAFRANPSGAVLFSTLQPARMRAAARVADAPPDELAATLEAFSSLIRSELLRGRPAVEVQR